MRILKPFSYLAGRFMDLVYLIKDIWRFIVGRD
jgi:hypothetical protein